MTDPNLDRNCERCGAGFRCGAREGSCWCFGLTVSPEARLEIGRLYTDCICEACLAAFAENVRTDENEEEKQIS